VTPPQDPTLQAGPAPAQDDDPYADLVAKKGQQRAAVAPAQVEGDPYADLITAPPAPLRMDPVVVMAEPPAPPVPSVPIPSMAEAANVESERIRTAMTSPPAPVAPPRPKLTREQFDQMQEQISANDVSHTLGRVAADTSRNVVVRGAAGAAGFVAGAIEHPIDTANELVRMVPDAVDVIQHYGDRQALETAAKLSGIDPKQLPKDETAPTARDAMKAAAVIGLTTLGPAAEGVVGRTLAPAIGSGPAAAVTRGAGGAVLGAALSPNGDEGVGAVAGGLLGAGHAALTGERAPARRAPGPEPIDDPNRQIGDRPKPTTAEARVAEPPAAPTEPDFTVEDGPYADLTGEAKAPPRDPAEAQKARKGDLESFAPGMTPLRDVPEPEFRDGYQRAIEQAPSASQKDIVRAYQVVANERGIELPEPPVEQPKKAKTLRKPKAPEPAPAPAAVGDESAPAQAEAPAPRKVPPIQPDSRYADEENPEAFYHASVDMVKGRHAAIGRADDALASPKLTERQRKTYETARAHAERDYEGALREFGMAFGEPEADRLRAETNVPRAATPTPTTATPNPGEVESTPAVASDKPGVTEPATSETGATPQVTIFDHEGFADTRSQAEMDAVEQHHNNAFEPEALKREKTGALAYRTPAGEITVNVGPSAQLSDNQIRVHVLKTWPDADPERVDVVRQTADPRQSDRTYKLGAEPAKTGGVTRLRPNSRYSEIPAVIEAASDEELASERAKLNESIDSQRSALADQNPKKGGFKKKAAARKAIEDLEKQESLYALEQERRAEKNTAAEAKKPTFEAWSAKVKVEHLRDSPPTKEGEKGRSWWRVTLPDGRRIGAYTGETADEVLRKAYDQQVGESAEPVSSETMKALPTHPDLPAELDTPEIRALRAKANTLAGPTGTPDDRMFEAQQVAAMVATAKEKGIERPQFHYAIGIMGAGKTTLLVDPLVIQTGGAKADADVPKEASPYYADGLGAQALQGQSSAIRRDATRALVEQRSHIVYPTIGHPVNTLRQAQELQRVGYTVHVHMVDLSPIEAAKRSYTGFTAGGRHFADPVATLNIGDHPRRTFAALSDLPGVIVHDPLDNDVPKGSAPRVVRDWRERWGYATPAERGAGESLPAADRGRSVSGQPADGRAEAAADAPAAVTAGATPEASDGTREVRPPVRGEPEGERPDALQRAGRGRDVGDGGAGGRSARDRAAQRGDGGPREATKAKHNLAAIRLLKAIEAADEGAPRRRRGAGRALQATPGGADSRTLRGRAQDPRRVARS
jgi:hypothetical protein